MLKGPPKSTRDDPNFVQSFYKSSRLHFIGTWKARIETLMESDAARRGPQPAPYVPGRPRVVMHIDMDCFFASVAEAAHPVFKGKPLAVCHSASAHGTGEVSTCNYEARAFGVRSGMMISRAKDLCPDLIVVPYMFAAYEETSEKVYGILLRHSACVQALSCDEAYLDVTGLGDPEQLAATIRAEIAAATGCTASAGIGPNPLLARIATDHAKPNGQLAVTQAAAAQYLQALPVKDLPGVGWSTEQKLEGKGITTVADVLARSKEALQAELGPKLGAQLWDYAHGRDDRRVEPPKKRKSVGAEVNWGVRFQSDDDARRLLDSIAADVQQRLQQGGLKGRRLTLKLKRRKQGAAEPLKFMGHGDCDNLSRSVTLARFTDSAEDIGRECWELLRASRVPFADIRGMGITVQLLNNDSASSSARPGAQAPSKLAAPPATRSDPGVWANFWRQQEGQPPLQALQAQQAQQAQQASGKVAAQSPVQPPRGKPPSPVPPLPAEAALSSLQAAAAAQQQQQQQQGTAEPGPHQAGRTSPVAGKQRSLEAMLERHVAAEAAGAAGKADAAGPADAAGAAHGEAALAVRQRQQLVDQWQGMTLSQMDASVLAALPWSVQKELIESLPRGRPQHAEQQAGTVQQPALAQRLEAAAPGVGAVAAVEEAAAGAAAEEAQQQQQQQQPEPMHVDGIAGPGQQQQQQQHLKHSLDGQESSDEEAGWEPDSEPQQAGNTTPAAAATSDPSASTAAAAPPQQQHHHHLQQYPQQKAAGVPSPVEQAGPSGSRPAGTPIAALPAFSQVDPSVLEALPLEVRWELEQAYGLRRPRRPAPPAHHRRGRGGSGAAPARPTHKRQRLDSFLSNPPPFGITAGGRAVAAQHQQLEAQRLSLSQVDPAVLAELPPDVQQEVVQQLQAAGGSLGGPAGCKQKLQQRSRLGLQRDEARAWQQRWAEEQQQRDAQAAAAVQAAGGLLSQGSDLVEQLLSPPGQQEEDEEEEQEEEEEDGVGSQEHGAPSLLPAVQQFAQLVAGRHEDPSASSLAAALTSCLDQMEGQAGAAAGQLAAELQQLQQQPQQPPPQQQPHAQQEAQRGQQPATQHSPSFDGAADGTGGGDGGLPPTQPVELEMQDAPAAADAVQAAAALAGPQGLEPAGEEAGHAIPDERQRQAQQVQQAQQDPISPPAARGLHHSPGAGSPGSQRSRALQRSLHALGRSLQQAAAALLAARDLEQLRLLLLAVQRLGRRHPWFAEGAGQAALDAAQQGVQAQYGWKLRLGPGLLEDVPAAEGGAG